MKSLPENTKPIHGMLAHDPCNVIRAMFSPQVTLKDVTIMFNFAKCDKFTKLKLR